MVLAANGTAFGGMQVTKIWIAVKERRSSVK